MTTINRSIFDAPDARVAPAPVDPAINPVSNSEAGESSSPSLSPEVTQINEATNTVVISDNERPASTRTSKVTGEKGKVSCIGFEIAPDLESVLKKFAERMGKEVKVIAVNPTDLSGFNFTAIKNTITIFTPVKVDQYSRRYPATFGTYGAAHFIDDKTVSRFFKGTPYTPTYIDSNIAEGLFSMYIALSIKDEMFLLFDLLTKDSPVKDNFVKKAILCQMLKSYEHDQDTMEQRVLFDRAILNDYMKWVRLLKDGSKNALKEKIRDIQREISNHWLAINKRERELRDAQILFASIAKRLGKNKQDTDNSAVTKMMAPLLTSGKYKKFEFTATDVKAYTGPIELTNYGKKYHIGEFKIKVALNGDVTFDNLTNTKENYQHPHIMDTKACFGNIKEMVSTMILNFNFLPLFDLLHKYLMSYNEQGPYVKLEIMWGDRAVDWCDRCERPRANCSCVVDTAANTCRRCHLNLNECTCNRCPSSDQLVEDEDCENCEHYGEDGCNY